MLEDSQRGTGPSLIRTVPSSLKGRGMNFRTYGALLHAVALVIAGCASAPDAPETYAWAPVRPPAVPGTGLPTPGQPGQVRPQPLPRSPHKRVLPPTREPGLWAGDAPRASQEQEAHPTPEGAGANRSKSARACCGRSRPIDSTRTMPSSGE
jgi:hypothetical protein